MWRHAFPMGGMFSHVRGKVCLVFLFFFFFVFGFSFCFSFCFFLPWTHVGLLKEFLRGFAPHAFAFSSPSNSLETLEVMCAHTVTLGHQTMQGGTWGAARKSQAPLDPAPYPPLKSMFLPHGTSQVKHVLPGSPQPSTDNTDFLLEEREDLCASQACLETDLPMIRDTFHRGEMFLHVDVCFPGRGSCTPQHAPAFSHTSGPAHASFLQSRREQTSS